MTFNEFIVMVWGGLRGAVGISFAMIASADEEIPLILRDLILFDFAGCAMLTLVVNATTTGFIIDKLGFLAPKKIKQLVFMDYLTNYKSDINNKIDELKRD